MEINVRARGKKRRRGQDAQKNGERSERRKMTKMTARRMKREKKVKHEILSRMNQAAERVLFLARIYAPRRSSPEPGWGVFRSRCG